MPVVVLIVAVVLAAIALVPLSLVLRLRAGTMRRVARGWIAGINAIGFGVSSLMFLLSAGVMTAWVPGAFSSAVLGLVGGCVLGLLGLAATRWEATPRALYYTPNRLLVTAITLVVAGRLLYGFWRGWQAWGATPEHTTWLAAAGAAGSLAAGAVVLGYYLTFWVGVRRRVARFHHQQR